MKEYYPNLDMLKGIAILLMVMGHGIAWTYPDWHFLTSNWHDMSSELFNAAFIWKLIYSFHMPLLFFVSGYLFYKKESFSMKTVRALFVKRVKRLLIPYLTTGIFVWLLKGYFGYWFFIVLFVLNILVLAELYIEELFSVKRYWEIVCHCLVFIFIYLSSHLYGKYLPIELANLAALPQYYLVFMFGYLLHKHSRLEEVVLSSIGMLISFVFYVLLMVLVVYFNKYKMFSFFIPLSAIAFLYSFSKKEKQSLVYKGFKIIGKYSMEIYVLHLFFVIQIPIVGEYILTMKNFPTSITVQLFYSLIISFVAIFFSITIANLINSNKYLSIFFWGK